MIQVIAHLVDFMDTIPISNAEVTLTVQAIANLVSWIDAKKPNNFLLLLLFTSTEAPETQSLTSACTDGMASIGFSQCYLPLVMLAASKL
jgi:hypothetical protein